MELDGHAEALSGRASLLWGGAFLLYGVGDTVTTTVGLATGGVAEAGPVAAPLLEAYGVVALPAVKAVVFALFFVVWLALRRPGRGAVPLALAVVGGLITVWNLVVIGSAL